MPPAIELGWNIVLAAAEIAALVLVRPPRRAASVAAFAWVVLASLALPLTGEGFATLRLWAWAIFAHLPALLVALAALNRPRPRLAAALAAAALAILALAADAFLLEPRRLVVENLAVASPKVSKPFRIAVLSDIQTDDVGDHERRAVREAMAARPDLVLLTGDYVEEEDDTKRLEQYAKLRAVFREEGLGAPMGVFAVMGDNDSGDWQEVFGGLPVRTSVETFDLEAGGVAIVGLSLPDSRRRDLKIPGATGFQVAFGHAPDFSLGDVGADLLVAGHTHGGQVQVPGFGPILTLTRIPRSQAGGGAHDLGGGRTLVVSRGIGMERGSAPRLRFWCAPQVVLIDVVPSK